MRLLDEMEAEAKRLEGRAAGFKMAGERRLAEGATCSAIALRHAIKEIENHVAALGEAREMEREA